MVEKTKKLNVKRWFLIVIGLVLLLTGITAWLLFYTDFSYSITISPETTIITEPLFPDGRVNFNQAMNKITGRDVTPETNGAIPFAKLAGNSWHKLYPPEMYSLFCERLGVKPEELMSDSMYLAFVCYEKACETYIAKMEKEWLSKADGQESIDATNERIEALKQEIDQAERFLYDRPWSGDKYPYAEFWLAQNENALAAVTEAVDRTHWYCPFTESADFKLFIPFQPFDSQMRHCSRIIGARAMLRIGQGRFDDAWRDTQTINRMARLIANEPSIASYMGIMLIDRHAFNTTVTMLAHPSLSNAKRRAIVAEIKQLNRLKIVGSPAWISEHYFGLEVIQLLPLDGMSAIADNTSGEEITPYDRALRNMLRYRVDWDSILKRYNQYFEKLTEAMEGPNRPERIRKVKAVIARYTLPDDDGKLNLSEIIFSRNPNDLVFSVVIGCLSTTTSMYPIIEDKAILRQRILEIVGRLALYHNVFGEYPDRLDALKIFPLDLDPISDDLLDDPFAETGQFQYKKNPDDGEGYLIYSVGPNNIDDGGRSSDDNNCDDIAVRIGPEGYIPPSVWNVGP